MADALTYESLNKAWAGTARVVLGGEVGELNDYASWLSEPMHPLLKRSSSVSGADVYCGIPYYDAGAKFASLAEIDFSKQFEPLNINEMKDIDAVVQAVQERLYYAGNVVLGTSRFVEESSNVTNSHYVLHCNQIFDCKFTAYSTSLHSGQYIFGSNNDAYSSHVIHGWDINNDKRSFELWKSVDCNDCYYSFGIDNCSNVMFCFNITRGQNMIGNTVVDSVLFNKLKQKLLEDVRADLTSKKRAPSLLDLLKESAGKELPDLDFSEPAEQENKAVIDDAFRKTSAILLGKPLSDIDTHGKWLSKHLFGMSDAKSVASGRPLQLPHRMPYPLLPVDRLVGHKEARKISQVSKLSSQETISLEALKKSFGRIAFFTPEFRLGENANLICTPAGFRSFNCYKGILFSENQYAAYCFWARKSKYAFGCEMTLSSDFCINSNYSSSITRCLEVDSTSNSSDLYFSHNCENMSDAMFCFNTKNKHNSIGNSPLERDKYHVIKKSILEQLSSELEKNKDLKWSVYNIAKNK